MEHDAIYQLYSNVRSIKEDGANFICLDENGAEVSIDMAAVNTKATELENEKIAEKDAKDNLKASAKAKLVAGEALTQEEADTIVL